MSFLRSGFRSICQASSRQLVRSYASEAPSAVPNSGKLLLNFVAPHQTFFKNTEVQQVNLSATTGDMGILGSHVPSIEQLKPGVLEVVVDATKTEKWFVSGGFAVINPDSSLNINAVEAFPIDSFDKEAVSAQLAEAQRVASGSGTEQEKAAASIQIEVYEALNSALSK
ncbi:delta subunit of the central stalk of mitochondrial F1F0 ATP synthase, atp16 [Entomophthora muscae]|uniref:Delta subunit of the central stalk of mitochondrial F1F0 ATP synthase, atp16 n=1 Tax=Entomophthora muscae TaxID=34485 RepID=A0ACC2RJE3_9FUNG|nr:delta subunit of the central stalk of mitochondrial F1F0 ATP synthase, atp16 [Entomophthora muscae]